MNSLVIYPLLILIVIGSFYQIYKYDKNYNLSANDIYSQNISGIQTLNDTEQELELEQGSLSLNFDMTTGLIAIIVGAIALGLIGVKVLGSGLDGYSIKIIWNGIVFYGLWAIFSILAFNSIVSIPFFGVLLWFLLTVFYTLGVFGKMGSGGSDS